MQSREVQNKACMPKALGYFALALLCALLPSSSRAQEIPPKDGMEKKSEKLEDLPVPNLTVNFTLNSALPEEYTAYYREIVKEALKTLPTEVELPKNHPLLLAGKTKYDHLRVVAYMPTEDSTDLNDPTQKEILYFDLRFKVPSAPPKEVAEEGAEKIPSGVINNAVTVHKSTRFDDFMQKVEKVKEGEELNMASAQPTVLTLSTEMEKPQEPAQPTFSVSLFEQELARIAKEGKAALGSQAGVATPAQKTIGRTEAQKTAPKAQSPKAQPKASSDKLALTATSKAEVPFFGNEEDLNEAAKQKLAAIAQKMKAEGLSAVRITSYTLPSLEKSWQSIYEERRMAVVAYLQSQGVATENLKFSEMRLKASTSQSITVEALR